MLAIDDVKRLNSEMLRVGADPVGISLMLPKGILLAIKVEQVGLKAVLILKQEMLSRGGEAVVSRNVATLEQEHSDILLIGTFKQFTELIAKLKLQPFGLKKIAAEITEVITGWEARNEKYTIDCNGKALSFSDKTLVMGILNLTPDSFSDGGKYTDVESAVQRALEMERDGADIIDIGGESTRPGHTPISAAEELSRILPVLERLTGRLRIPISVDTSKSEVAEGALAAGANMINDIWGLKRDPRMAEIVARYNVPVILMHNREIANYNSLISDIISDLRESIEIAFSAGITADKIILDPGIGFAKSYREELLVMNRLTEIVNLGYSVLLAASRKSMIGSTLNLDKGERLEGTIATVCQAIAKGCQLVRVHDVLEVKRAVTMMDAIVNAEEGE
jgi:dihydropteroate synthase